MAGKWHPKRRRILAAGVAAVGLVSIASAQDELGGKTLRLTLGQFLEYSDNIDLRPGPTDDVLRSSTRVGLSYSDITRTQAFDFTTGGAYNIDSDGQTELNDPFARLSYALEGANSHLDLSASYVQVNLDDAVSNYAGVPGGNPLNPVSGVALIEEGVRINTDYALGFETGLQSKIGFRLDLAAQDRHYTQTTDPDLYETSNRLIGMVTTFRIDPRITARLIANGRHYTAEDADQTDRTETSYGAGVALDVAPDTSLDLSLLQQRTEVERLSGTTVSDGLAYAAELDRDLPNGSIGGEFNSEPTLNGRRNTLRATRSMALRRDGTLSYGIGVTKTGSFSAEPLFSLAYVQPLKLGRFGVELSQEARTDEEDDTAVILTRASANYAVPLSETLNWSVSAGLAEVNGQGNSGEDRRSFDLRSDLTGQINDISSWSAGISLSDTRNWSSTSSQQQNRYGIDLTYRRELAREWDLVARYQYTDIQDTAAADRQSNAISVGLEKSFDFRP